MVMTEEQILAGCNPGIRKTVAAFRAAGFRTTDSGDGLTRDHECDRDHGYVVLVTDASALIDETHRAAALLKAMGFAVVAAGYDDPDHGSVIVESSYSPADGLAIINIMHVTDAMWQEAEAARLLGRA